MRIKERQTKKALLKIIQGQAKYQRRFGGYLPEFEGEPEIPLYNQSGIVDYLLLAI
jgi:hypothetical protein